MSRQEVSQGGARQRLARAFRLFRTKAPGADELRLPTLLRKHSSIVQRLPTLLARPFRPPASSPPRAPTAAMAAVDTHAPGYSSFMGDAMEGMDDSWMPQSDILPTGEPDASILDELSSMEYMASAPAPAHSHQTAPGPCSAPALQHHQNPHHPHNSHHQHQSSVGTPPLNLGAAAYHNHHQSYHALSSPLTPCAPSSFTSPLKRKHPMSSMYAPQPKKPALLSNFGTATKVEPVLVAEPLTPSSSHRQLHPMGTLPPPPHHPQHNIAYPPTMQSQAAPVHPLSPLCDSSCSDDEDSAVVAADVPLATSPLPVLTAFAAAKRRALRVRALKRQRARTASKQESVVASNLQSSTGEVEDKEEADSVHVDKKTARAIRNRLAASRSRVEAKMKMQSLAEANDELAGTVQSLKDENAALQKQLQALLAHTFGDNVPVDDVLSVFESMKDGR